MTSAVTCSDLSERAHTASVSTEVDDGSEMKVRDGCTGACDETIRDGRDVARSEPRSGLGCGCGCGPMTSN